MSILRDPSLSPHCIYILIRCGLGQFIRNVFFFFFLNTAAPLTFSESHCGCEKMEEKADRLHFLFCPFDIVATEVLSSLFWKKKKKKPPVPECAQPDKRLSRLVRSNRRWRTRKKWRCSVGAGIKRHTSYPIKHKGHVNPVLAGECLTFA